MAARVATLAAPQPAEEPTRPAGAPAPVLPTQPVPAPPETIAWTSRPEPVADPSRFVRLDARVQEAAPVDDRRFLTATVGRPAQLLDSASFGVTVGGTARLLRVRGLVGMRFDRICTMTENRRQPCGGRARVAINAALAGKSLECTLAEGASELGAGASCRFERGDLAAWLVREGFATPSVEAAPEFVREVRSAHQFRRGYWADVGMRAEWERTFAAVLERRPAVNAALPSER